MSSSLIEPFANQCWRCYSSVQEQLNGREIHAELLNTYKLYWKLLEAGRRVGGYYYMRLPYSYILPCPFSHGYCWKQDSGLYAP